MCCLFGQPAVDLREQRTLCCPGVRMEVREQLIGLSFLFLPCGSWGLNYICPAEPSHQPLPNNLDCFRGLKKYKIYEQEKPLSSKSVRVFSSMWKILGV